jgi:hypothetical protein
VKARPLSINPGCTILSGIFKALTIISGTDLSFQNDALFVKIDPMAHLLDEPRR